MTLLADIFISFSLPVLICNWKYTNGLRKFMMVVSRYEQCVFLLCRTFVDICH